MALPDSADALPEIPVLTVLEEAVKAHPRIVAYFITLLVAVILISSWITAWVSNMRYRNELSKHYLLKPESCARREPQTSIVSEPDSGTIKE